jgi:hypothetical protein
MVKKFTDKVKLSPAEKRTKRLRTIAIALAFVATYFFFVKLLFL